MNLFIVMFLGGLWHGAAWSYAVWGVSHGVLLAIEKLFADITQNRASHSLGRWRHILMITITFHITSLLWLLFLMPNFTQVINYFRLIVTTETIVASMQNIFIVAIYSLPVVIYHLAFYLREHPVAVKAWPDHTKGANLYHANSEALVLAVMLFLIILNAGTSGAFIYFQF